MSHQFCVESTVSASPWHASKAGLSMDVIYRSKSCIRLGNTAGANRFASLTLRSTSSEVSGTQLQIYCKNATFNRFSTHDLRTSVDRENSVQLDVYALQSLSHLSKVRVDKVGSMRWTVPKDKMRWREVMTKGKTRRPNGESGASASIAALQQTSALTSTSEQPFILSQENNS
jgi:hypothetical protein